MELAFLCWLALSSPEPQKAQTNPQDSFYTIDLKDKVIVLRHQYKHKPIGETINAGRVKQSSFN